LGNPGIKHKLDLKAARNICYFLLACLLIPASASAQVFADFRAGFLDFNDRKWSPAYQVSALNANPLLEAYDVKFYGLDVDMDDRSDQIKGNVTILLEIKDNPLSALVFELINSLSVDRILVDGLDFTYTHEGNEIVVPMPVSPSVGSLLRVQIFYGGQTGEGMVNQVDDQWNIPVTYTLSEPFNAKDWFPCKENLGDKADSVHVFITTEARLKAVSQGRHTGTTYYPNGKVRYEWKSNYPIAYYLISIAVADYLEYSLESHPPGVEAPFPVQNFVYDVPGCLDAYRDQINVTLPIMDVYCELFGPYPFRAEKYGHYLWPWGGGMEHQTLTGMGNFEFYLIAHDLGHSWFGDYVTCATWQDIWINQGSATFAGYMATERLGPDYADGEREYRFERALREPEGSVYIPVQEADNPSRIFSSNLSYSKGMAILYMMRYEMQNDALFFQALRTFIGTYADSVATGLDFKAVLEETSGMDFTDFFNQWYFGAGFPIFETSWEQQDGMLDLYVNQTGSSAGNPLFKMSMEYRVVFAQGDTLIRVFHDENQEHYRIPVNGQVQDVIIDPGNQVLKEITGQEKGRVPLDNHSSFSLYPNPNQGVFSFKSALEGEEDVQVEIYSITGRLILESRFEGCMPYMQHELNTGGLNTGIYFVRFSTASHEEIIKMMVE